MGSGQAAGSASTTDLSLTEHDIRRWVGTAAFGRGLRYYRRRQILHPRQQGSTLHARCAGTEHEPYHLWVTLDAHGIVDGRCTCYVGASGRCKHVAALLLTWLLAPERFLASPQPVGVAVLEQRSKGELVDLIQQMLARHPDLESLLDLPLADAWEEPADGALDDVDLSEALALAEEQFWLYPDLDGYAELRDLYRQSGRWKARRGVLLARLEDEGHHHLLTRIHLQAGEADRALEALGPALASPWGNDELALRVAAEVEASRPRAALTLYRYVAERAIESRTRHAYAHAAHLLTRVRALYHGLNEPEAWQSYIADLRQAHRRLRAFQDELNRAGIE